jgi:hypothetical protein
MGFDMTARQASWTARLPSPVREMAPYALVALTLPGGILIALVLLILRRVRRLQSLETGRS